jgi:hypothetical protein
MHETALAICLPISLAAFGLFGKFAFDMKRDKNFRSAWGWSFWAVCPGFLSALYLASNPGMAMELRNVVLGVLGGAVGMCGAIWLGYAITAATAQQGTITQSTPPQMGDNNTLLNTPTMPMGSGTRSITKATPL